jgi:rhodanese-related sulfurtransferase
MTRMAGASTWGRFLIADSAWFGIAAVIALAAGVAGDQLLGQPPLGLRYQTAVQRVLTTPAPDVPQEPINLVSLEEVTALLSRPEVVALDARPRVFYEIGHLPGARSLSREQFDADFLLIEPALRVPGKTLLVYCSDANCEDSALVARALQKRGLGPLLIFPGGFAEWEAAGQPVETQP